MEKAGVALAFQCRRHFGGETHQLGPQGAGRGWQGGEAWDSNMVCPQKSIPIGSGWPIQVGGGVSAFLGILNRALRRELTSPRNLHSGSWFLSQMP